MIVLELWKYGFCTIISGYNKANISEELESIGFLNIKVKKKVDERRWPLIPVPVSSCVFLSSGEWRMAGRGHALLCDITDGRTRKRSLRHLQLIPPLLILIFLSSPSPLSPLPRVRTDEGGVCEFTAANLWGLGIF